jgi:hypothetical protein
MYSSNFIKILIIMLVTVYNLVMKFFEELVYERICIIFYMVLVRQLILHNSSYGHLWTIPKLIHIYPVSKPNYLTSFLITISYLYNYFIPFLIIISVAYSIAPTSKCEHMEGSTDFSFQTQFLQFV